MPRPWAAASPWQDLAAVLQGLPRWERAPKQAMAQGLALQQLEDDVRRTLVRPISKTASSSDG